MTSSPYLAAEDSALLRSALELYGGERCLEIGAGNGGNLLALSKKFRLVLGTDIAKPGTADWKGVGGEFILADAASCFKDRSFDLVAFNPPYLESGRVEDPAVDGGSGLAVPKRLLREALRVVEPKGRVVMLLNDGANLEEFARICSDSGFGLRLVARKPLFFEELLVFEATKAP